MSESGYQYQPPMPLEPGTTTIPAPKSSLCEPPPQRWGNYWLRPLTPCTGRNTGPTSLFLFTLGWEELGVGGAGGWVTFSDSGIDSGNKQRHAVPAASPWT